MKSGCCFCFISGIIGLAAAFFLAEDFFFRPGWNLARKSLRKNGSLRAVANRLSLTS